MIKRILKYLGDIETHLFWIAFALGMIAGLFLAGVLIKLGR